jgi:glycerate 2-kinase
MTKRTMLLSFPRCSSSLLPISTSIMATGRWKSKRLYYTAAAAAALATSTSSSCHAAAFCAPRVVLKNNPQYVAGTLDSSITTRFSTTTAINDTPVTSFRRTAEEVEMTNDALAMIEQAIHAVNPTTAIQRHVGVDTDGILTIHNNDDTDQCYSANDYDKVVLVAFGKASSAMAAACVEQLQQHEGGAWSNIPLEGVVIVKDDHATAEEETILAKFGIVLQEASHPVPDERSVAGARAIRELVVSSTKTKRTLLLCCISGGGSSLFCEPIAPLTLYHLQATNEALLASGLGITDMNVIRKRCDANKGGKLLQHAIGNSTTSTLVTLVLSDIIGDPLDLIASGPTVPDSSQLGDAWRLVQSNPVLKASLPEAVQMVIKDAHDQEENAAGGIGATTAALHNTVLVGNNALAVQAAAEEAERRGYHTVVLGTRMEGETKHVAGVYTSMAQHIATSTEGGAKFVIAKRPAALIAGGETTVTLPPTNTGKGGRNQELAIAAALQFHQLGLRNVVLASVGTDGTDGPTDAAGAVVDGGTIHRLAGSAEEALQQHNGYPYLDQIEEEDGHSPLIKTGPTGTNVADVCVTLIR